MKTIYKSYKYRVYPTQTQKELLIQTFGSVRYVWNTILDWRNKEYIQNKTKINYSLSSKKLTEIKCNINWLKNISSVALQQTLKDQDIAFNNFFSKRSKFPKFKSKHSHQSFRLLSNAFSFNNGLLKIAKLKQPLNVKWSRIPKGTISSITISKDNLDKYFVSLLSEESVKPKPMSTHKVGIDLGLTHFVITSNGEKYIPLKATMKYAQKLKKLQKRLSKKQHSKYKGDTTPKSNNYIKMQKKVAKVHTKIAFSRNDFLQKLSTKLINENQVICLENLNVVGMVKNRKLSKHISDASWSKFVSMLQYKANWYDRTLSFVSTWFPSSQLCSNCGIIAGKKPLNVRNWICPNCYIEHDRDINAANNILTAGLAGFACGDSTARDLT